MKKILEFMRKERLYILLAIFVLLVTAILMGEQGAKSPRAVKPAAAGIEKPAVAGKAEGELFMKREDIEAALVKDKDLAIIFGLASLLMTAIFLLGIVIDIILALRKAEGGATDIAAYRTGPARWGVWDIVRVVILFLFFGYILIMIESFILSVAPVFKNDNFRMIFNTSILDILTVVFIIYFTVNLHKEKLEALGLSFKNFKQNVFYGVVGYIAAVPVLVAAIALIAFVVHITKYIPEKQPVVELFLKEENRPFLVYTSVFTAIVGPFIEELFFRGFMYNAFKRTIGIFWAMLITSALFAVLHTNIVGFMPIFIIGLLLAYMYEKTGTLVSSITVHIMHNLSMVFLVFLVKHVKV